MQADPRTKGRQEKRELADVPFGRGAVEGATAVQQREAHVGRRIRKIQGHSQGVLEVVGAGELVVVGTAVEHVRIPQHPPMPRGKLELIPPDHAKIELPVVVDVLIHDV
jgi:hypothetical protein